MEEQLASESKTLDKFTDEEIRTLVVGLEDQYPHLNRLKQGYKLIGFKRNKNAGEVPVWAYIWPDSKYSCANLRELRSQRGVGAKERKKFYRNYVKQRSEALDELARVSQELGLYENVSTNHLDKAIEVV